MRKSAYVLYGLAALVAFAAGLVTPSAAQTQTQTKTRQVQSNSAQSAVPPVAPPSFLGLWIDDTGDGAVEIKPCGTTGALAQLYCGNIYWLRNPNDAKGQPLRDGYNQETKERRRPICGLPVIGLMKRQPDGTLDGGFIYDPRQGKRFELELTLKGAEKLQVKGYKGFKFLSKTFVWTRAPAETLPKCVPPV